MNISISTLHVTLSRPKACEYHDEQFTIFVNAKYFSLGKKEMLITKQINLDLKGRWVKRVPCMFY